MNGKVISEAVGAASSDGAASARVRKERRQGVSLQRRSLKAEGYRKDIND